MTTSLLLYALPFVIRAGHGEFPEWWRVLLSFAPLFVVFPSTLLPRVVSNENHEHVWRHALYALGFTVSAGTSVRWDVIDTALREGESWAPPLVLYLVLGILTLWWFCLSHVLENESVVTRMYTHQGDVAVLPLTLVAIATFVESVPDEAFQFSRSIIFFVPVVVAWATLHFVAYNDFAISTTTTHTTQTFDFLAHSGLIIASAQLSLLEMRASAASFQFFPVVAAVLCQFTARPEEAPRLREGRHAGMLVLCLGLGAGVAGSLFVPLLGNSAYAAWGTVSSAACLAIPRSAGPRWMLPAALYSTLLLGTYYETATPTTVLLLVSFSVLYFVIQVLAPPTARALVPPHDRPPVSDRTDTPQSDVHGCSPSKLMQPLDAIPLCACRIYDEDGHFLQNFYPKGRSRSACPKEFVGVWWMCGNAFPMQLTSVHNATWRDTPEEGGGTAKVATLWMREDTTRSATVSGLLLWLGQLLCVVRVTAGSSAFPSQRWIRTQGHLFPGLRWLPDTYWLYRVSDDEMLRLVFDAQGKIVWQYRMLRICTTTPAHKTRHYYDFMRQYKGRAYWFG